jgi:hypothetical protein
MSFILNTSNIAPGAAMPFKKGILDYLYYDELQNTRNLVVALTNNANIGSIDPLCLEGMVKTNPSGSTYSITGGVLFFQTRFYNADTTTVTLGVGQVIIGTLTTTNPFVGATADPVTFSDSSVNSVLDFTNVVWSAGTSGSGDFDFDDLVFLQNPTRQVGTIATAQWQDGAGGSTFNYYKVPFNKLVIDTRLQKASSGTATIITLPVGYRPASDRTFMVFGGSVNPTTQLKFKVATTGAVTFEQAFVSPIGIGTGDIYDVYVEIPLY